MPKVSSKERILATIRREQVDHVPLGQLFHSTILQTPKELRWHNQFERAKVMKGLGLDPVIDIWMPTPTPPPEIPVRTWMQDDTDGPDPLLCAAYETPAGTLTVKVRRTEEWYHHTHYRFLPGWDGNAHRAIDDYDRIGMMDDWFTRRYKVPLVKGPEDLDAFEYILQPPTGRTRDLWIQQARQASQIADELRLATQARRLCIGDWFMWVCWIEDFCCQMIENPDYVNRLFDIINNYNKKIIDMVLEVEPDIIQYKGWYDTPDYWGTQRYQDICVPRITELGAQIRDGGSLFCVLFTEGYTLYRQILAKMNADVYLGLEPLAARKSEDLATIKEALKDSQCIWGGVNACVTVGRGTDQEIDNAVRTAIETLGPRGFILNASIYFYDNDVTWDRFLCFVNAWKKYAGLQ